MKRIFIVFLFFANCSGYAQDTIYARRIIDTLTSPSFNGRGYTKHGLCKAEKFLKNEFLSIGLLPLNGNEFNQPFSFSVNTFPCKMEVTVNNNSLRPGKDFLAGADAGKIKGEFVLHKLDSTHYVALKGKLKITLEDKLTWRVSKVVNDTTEIKILKSALKSEPEKIKLNLRNKFIKKFSTANICAFIKGTQQPDSLIIFSAHYDHLGGMGEHAFFPGANDNASGISLLLGLAKWYVKNPQRYSIGFICFSGEEAGLVGSEYFVNHPLVPLNKIRFLVNLDLTGTGVEGITVVNATEFVNDFALLKSINEKENLLSAINSRGKAKNSDHYWFTEKGVPSFFIYTLGGIKAYHDVYDISATLPNDHYIQLFKLLTIFVGRLND